MTDETSLARLKHGIRTALADTTYYDDEAEFWCDTIDALDRQIGGPLDRGDGARLLLALRYLLEDLAHGRFVVKK